MTTTTADPSKGNSATTTTDVSVPLSAIADAGLPSKVGPGPLKAPQMKLLMQFFENHVAQDFRFEEIQKLHLIRTDDDVAAVANLVSGKGDQTPKHER